MNSQTPPSPGQEALNRLDIEFTGTGSEYFRIWIVNLLLLLLTLGLYYPWAKVRKQRYFYGNTVVAGHPLGYHAEPLKMLKGFLLVAALMLAYSLASKTSSLAGGIAGLIVAAIWPALMRSSLQFRMANTSWRGLRLGFSGSLKDAYMVFLVPIACVLGIGLAAFALGALMGPMGRVLMVVVGVLGAYSMAPYAWWRLKRYQHSHYKLGQQQTSFKATFGEVTRVFMRTGLLGIAGLLLTLVMVAVLGFASAPERPPAGAAEGVAQQLMWIPAFLARAALPLAAAALVMQALVGAFFISRMQNLIWSKTGNRQLRFKSELRLLPLAKVSAINLVLLVITLGLYWPFAQVAMARLKLQAIHIRSRLNADQLVGDGLGKGNSAAGDMAADLLGFDIGL